LILLTFGCPSDGIMKTVLFVTNNIVVHVSQFGSCKTGSTTVGYAVGRRTIPCISNCWARPWGLQKIVYFNWGSTCRNVWEPLA